MRKRNVALVAMAAGIIATATWVAPAIGEEAAVVVDRGVARLQLTAAGDRITYDPLSGSDQIQQLGVSTGCTMSTSGASIMNISASSATPSKSPVPGLKDHRLGVGQKGEGTGEPCTRINKDLGQALTFTLNLGPNMAMDYAEIDINFKYNGEAGWKIFYKGEEVDADVLACTGSDCGPDSGADDNKRLIIGNFLTTGERTLFDRIELAATTPPNGAISVEGGQDPDERGPLGASLNTYDSLFRVVEVFDGELDCGEGFDVEDGAVVGAFFRLDNVPPPPGETDPPCTPKPYNAEASIEDGKETIYFAPSGSDQNARYRGTLTLGNRSAANPFTSNLKYDPEDDGSFKDMPWCDSVIYDGEPPVVLDPVVIGAEVPDGDTWCITGESTVVASPGFVTTTWSVFGYGDPKFQ